MFSVVIPQVVHVHCFSFLIFSKGTPGGHSFFSALGFFTTGLVRWCRSFPSWGSLKCVPTFRRVFTSRQPVWNLFSSPRFLYHAHPNDSYMSLFQPITVLLLTHFYFLLGRSTCGYHGLDLRVTFRHIPVCFSIIVLIASLSLSLSSLSLSSLSALSSSLFLNFTASNPFLVYTTWVEFPVRVELIIQ